MKKFLFFLAIAAFFAACNTDNSTATVSDAPSEQPSALTIDQNFVEFENLRLYPVKASNEFIVQNAAAADLVPLKSALELSKFRISEHKPFGRFEDEGAVNQLTVANKLPNDVFLMAGDVVQGGKQDRTIADDRIIASNSIKNIPVFCVEQGRWNYRGDINDSETKSDDRIMAFKGYYNVASNDIRKSIKSGNQQAVWDNVAKVTSSNEAESTSKAYAGLENSDAFTTSRTAYLEQFNHKLQGEDVVGMVAVSGDKIIGMDIFGHPQLFEKTYESLLHAYVTDAITNGEAVNIKSSAVEKYNKTLNRKINSDKAFKHEGAIIHYTDLK